MSKLHDWVGATVLTLDQRLAGQAHKNGKLTIISRVSVDVLEVYCRTCRQAFSTLTAGEPCQIGPQHIGGPRKQPDPLPLDGSDWPPPHDPLA